MAAVYPSFQFRLICDDGTTFMFPHSASSSIQILTELIDDDVDLSTGHFDFHAIGIPSSHLPHLIEFANSVSSYGTFIIRPPLNYSLATSGVPMWAIEWLSRFDISTLSYILISSDTLRFNILSDLIIAHFALHIRSLDIKTMQHTFSKTPSTTSHAFDYTLHSIMTSLPDHIFRRIVSFV
jgi:hypothetical protein